MSTETMNWLNTNVLVGFTDKRGKAWHYLEAAQGDESNSYAGAIPIADVERRLFFWEPELVNVEATLPAFLGPDGVGPKTFTDSRFQVVVRQDNGEILGVHSDRYMPHSYKHALLDNLGDILQESRGDLGIGSAGLLKRGAVAWVSVEVPENISVEGVVFRPNLLATTSLDGSLKTTYKRVITNVVCDNTHRAAMHEPSGEYRIRHTRNSMLALDDARQALDIIESVGEGFTKEIQTLVGTAVSDRQWDAFLDSLLEIKPGVEQTKKSKTMSDNKRDALNTLWRKDERVSPWRNTAWGVVQGVNTYEHHIKTVKGSDPSLTTDVKRIERNRLRGLGDENVDRDTWGRLQPILANA